MRTRTTVFVFVVALVAITAVAVPGAATLDEGVESTAASGPNGDAVAAGDHIESCTAEPPEDFADPEDEDGVIGWVDGIWYNEPLNINTENGLNDTEVTELGARTSARVEAIRCIDAVDGTPPIEIQTREEFKNNQSGLYANVSDKDRLSDNAVFETMLMISSEENSIDIREANRGQTVGGFYSFVDERIVMVTDDPENFLIEEYVLAQEVGHAIQDQQFNLSRYERPTTDLDNGILGLIEGDMNLVDQRYQEACEQDLWNEPCVSETTNESGGGGGDLPSWGLYFQGWQPYNDGPPFVQSLYEEEGWEAVNDLYENPPQSALYTTYPDTYGEVELADVEVPDQSSDEWERITWEDSLDYDTLGVGSIAAMFIAPTYESSGQQNVFDPNNILNTGPDGEVADTQPVNYQYPETEGWRDDKIYTYRNGDEAGAVWKIKWASAEDMQPFLDSYEKLVDIRNGEPVEGYENTYTFGEDSNWDMVLTIVPDGSTVTIVTAPTVDALTAIHDVDIGESSSDESTPTPTPTPTPDDTPTPTPTPADDGDQTPTETDGTDGSDGSDSTDSTETPEDSDDDGAGFGIVAGALAVTMTALVARRRRND
jgi:hypothetical protein